MTKLHENIAEDNKTSYIQRYEDDSWLSLNCGHMLLCRHRPQFSIIRETTEQNKQHQNDNETKKGGQ